MIHYSNIFQTGLQSLLAVACGWGCGHWRVLDAETTVSTTNTLVLKFCIPCLQIWLLACHTDMRQPGNWSAMAVFFLWSVSLQALLALQQLLTHRRLKLAQLGVDSLLLTTNNTGILGPVVLEAAVGKHYAPLGMLATVVLYFQQLPSAQLLFQLHKDQSNSRMAECQQHHQHHHQQHQQQHYELSSASAAGFTISSSSSSQAGHKLPTSPAPGEEEQQQLLPSKGQKAGSMVVRHCSSQDSLHHHTHHHQHQQQHQQQQQQPQSHDHHHQHQHQLHTDAEHGHARTQQQQQQLLLPSHAAAACSSNSSWRAAASVLSLLFRNSLVWSTGASLLLSCLGSSLLLDPAQPTALQHLVFVEQLLGWFAQTTAPLTLFTTGLWMYSNSSSSSSNAGTAAQQQPGFSEAAGAAEESAGMLPSLSMHDLCVYLLLRCTAAPALMVLLCWLAGMAGDLAHALVVLSLLPVAQTAFVVCKAYDIGMQAVSVVMVASLLLMLPQLMVVLALLQWLGVLEPPAAAE